MKKQSYLYMLAASALFMAGNAYAADTELVLGASEEGLTWTNASWSNGVPTAETSALINIADNTNPLTINGAAEAGQTEVRNNSYLLLTGAGNSLYTSLDLRFYNNSKIEVLNGASLEVKSGNTLWITDNSSILVDKATFTGAFYNKVNSAIFQNGATWNMRNSYDMWDSNIQVINSSINQVTGFNFGTGQAEGHTKVMTLQNSTWNTNGQGVSLSAIMNFYDSSITNGGHLNIGREGGAASYENVITLRGSSSKSISTLQTQNLWWNTNSNSSTTLHQAGNSNVSFSKFDSSNNTNGGGNVLWLFSGDNNSTTLTNSQDSSWGDNNKNNNTTGIWKITSAQTDGGVETFATNSTFNAHSIYLRVSSVEGNNFQSIIDWAGAGNTFKTSYDIFPCLSTGANTNTVSSFTVRNGALADIGAYVVVGGKVDASLSGTASFNVLSGATYNQKNHLVLQNSTVAGSTGQSEFNLENANWNRTGGNFYIGAGSNSRTDNPNQDAISGTSIATIKNAGTVTYGGNILLAGSSVDLRESENTHTNVAKLVIENTDFTINGELLFGHQNSYGATIYGGTAIIEINGENAAFRSPNKTLYSGYGNTVYGGTREINVNGKNNTLAFATNDWFYMNASGSGTQYGGALSVNLNGEGHTFSVRDFSIGRTNAMGGSNTVYSKGTNASNKNQILLSESNISIRGGAAGSTIVNTFHLAGNTILKRSNGETVNIGLATSATAGGTAAFKITGENNELYAYNFNMNSASSTGAKAIFEIEGSTHLINIANEFGFNAPSNQTLSTLSFVADSNGISTINAAKVTAFAGVLNIDFSKYVAQTLDPIEFTLISANNSWTTPVEYQTDSNNDYVNVIKAND
ncbi:MAG: hypothetical protein J6T16_06780, partial [Opitutales bacterium]|nr:hypothetical protein [Opitutales bacterium]